MLQFMIAGMP